LSIEFIPPRKISAKKAEDWIENVRTEATKGVICTLIKIGNAKKNQKSWTSGGVVRKNSMIKEQSWLRTRIRDIRPSARPKPSGTPKTSAKKKTCIVFHRPNNSRSISARVATKSHSYNNLSLTISTTIDAKLKIVNN
jgi:hypothetical protein